MHCSVAQSSLIKNSDMSQIQILRFAGPPWTSRGVCLYCTQQSTGHIQYNIYYCDVILSYSNSLIAPPNIRSCDQNKLHHSRAKKLVIVNIYKKKTCQLFGGLGIDI